ncbi:MAG: zf-TFIIB domain-containing protein [Sedimentisphaerales bacterium]|nr:zf-TFIIB domain-containing protein [Sedimentisphaerales bacterium]
MDCPVCRDPMVTLELAGVEIDHCLGCGGIWFDRGELEALMASPDETEQLIWSLRPVDAGREGYRRCPLCDRRMEKVALDLGQTRVVLDRCRDGDGLWFDKGELVQVLGGSGLADDRLMGLLARMFGIERGGQ